MSASVYRWLITGLLCLAGLASAMLPHATPALSATGASAVSCPATAEDDPAWDWTRCGNHKRGVVTVHGTPLVVGPCRFQYLFRTGHLAYVLRWTDERGTRHVDHLLTRMRGDRRALRGDCD